jgi:predicted NBD/HSP70 family sugar kinase
LSALRVLEAIRQREPVSRIELAKITGLSAAMVTMVTGSLIERGLVSEAGDTRQSRGRPRISLTTNPDGGLICGVMIHPEGVVDIEVANLAGQAVFTSSQKLVAHLFDPAFVDQLAAAIRRVCDDHTVDGRLLAIGVCPPTTIDGQRGLVHWMAADGTLPKPTPLKDMLESQLDLPVFLDTRENVIARRERWHGEPDAGDDMAVISIGPGIGLGQYNGKALRFGAHGFNSEFGHMKVPLAAGNPCACGGNGCLITVSSHYGILRMAKGVQSMLDPTLPQIRDEFEQIVEQATAGNHELQGLFDLAGRALGTAVANHVNLLDPARVVVVSENRRALNLMRPGFERQYATDALPLFREKVIVTLKADHPRDHVEGSIALVLDKMFGTS